MTKYWVLTMIGAVGLAALIHPERMKFLRSPAPWVAIVTFVVAMLPHLWWLKQSDFLPLVYADDVYGGQTLARTSQLASIYVAHNIALLLLPIALAAIALAWKLQWWKSIRAKGVFRELIESATRPWVRGPNPGVYLSQARNIWVTQIIVGLVPPIAAVVFGIYMKTDSGHFAVFPCASGAGRDPIVAGHANGVDPLDVDVAGLHACDAADLADLCSTDGAARR